MHMPAAGHPLLTPPSSRIMDAAGYFYMDVTMVGKDILIGVVISAILAVVIPHHFWTALFLKNNTHLPQVIMVLWNALIGMIIAIFAFVCSVGNILLALVLWRGGIHFGGVIAFILSDLITIPMLPVYRRYYGTPMMGRLLLILSLSILVTAVGVDYIFQWAGWIPHSPGHQMLQQMGGIQWNYKTWLNLIFIPLSFIDFFLRKKSMNEKMHPGPYSCGRSSPNCGIPSPALIQ
ncbi:MAG: permease [Chitinophagaceae bacterium]